MTVYKRMDGSATVESSSSATIGFTTTGGSLTIGADAFGGIGNRFVGQVDEFRVWSRPLSATEISILDNGPVPANSSELVGYWPFNDALGSVVRDYSVSKNDGVLTASNYRSEVRADSPVAYYRLNTVTSPTVDEISGRNGTVTGTTAISTPLSGGLRAGQALRFNGTSDRIDIPFNAALNPAGSFSLELWARVDGGAGTTRHLIDSTEEGSGVNGFYLAVLPDQTVLFGTGNGTFSQTERVKGPALATGVWTHLAATFEADSPVLDANGAFSGVASLFVNGELVASVITKYTPNSVSAMRIGNNGPDSPLPMDSSMAASTKWRSTVQPLMQDVS